MGTIVIYEFGNTGTNNSRSVSIADLSAQKARTQDATTSTTVESITLNQDTRTCIIKAEEDHRVSLVDSDCTTTYMDVVGDATGATTLDVGVKGGATLYYRLDA